MIIANDLHLGVVKKSGVTPSSQEALRNYTFEQLDKLLAVAGPQNLVVNGDLFDSFDCPARDWLATYRRFSGWLSDNTTRRLYLIAGNHDDSPRAGRVSSFKLLCEVLMNQHANCQCVDVGGATWIDKGVYAIAHCANQDLFDIRLNEALEKTSDGDIVLLHANYRNPYTEASDHSLSVSEDVAKVFADRGVTLLLGHEHQGKVEIPHGCREGAAPVIVTGNQWPTSVADCLGNDTKRCLQLRHGEITFIETCNVRDVYQELDWRNLDQDAQFIRIVGDATNAEAAQVIDAIHKFRQRSQAFVVTNAVKIDGIAEMGDLPETFEAAKKFDVMEFVYKQLDEAEAGVIRGIVGEME